MDCNIPRTRSFLMISIATVSPPTHTPANRINVASSRSSQLDTTRSEHPDHVYKLDTKACLIPVCLIFPTDGFGVETHRHLVDRLGGCRPLDLTRYRPSRSLILSAPDGVYITSIEG